MAFGGATSTISQNSNDSPNATKSGGSSKRFGLHNTSDVMNDDELNKLFADEKYDSALKQSLAGDENDASNSSVYNYVSFL